MRKNPLTTALYEREIKHSPSKKQTLPTNFTLTHYNQFARSYT